MKKTIYFVLTLILVFFICAYTLLFTSFGNKIVANIAQEKIKQNTGLDVNITRFDLRFNSLNLTIDLNNMANINVDGNLSLFKLGFDLDYLISLNKNYIKNMGLKLDQNLNFKGKAFGKASDFLVNGSGYLFGSNAVLNARILDYYPSNLDLNAKNIKIEELLMLVSMPKYIKGNIDLLAKIESKNSIPDGKGIVLINANYIDYDKIKKDFNLTLPKNSEIKSEILANINDKTVQIKSKTSNSYLSLQSEKTLYELDKNTLNTDFLFSVPNLSNLEELTKTKLSGNLSVNGNLSLAKNALDALNLNIIGLGGKIQANLKDNILIANINEADLNKILSLVGYGNLLEGKINANLTSKGLDFSNFDADAKINNAKLNAIELKKLTNIELVNTVFSLDAKANAKNNNIAYDAILSSNLLNIKKLNGTYNLNNSELNTNIDAFIDDLSQFNAITGQKLQGKAELNTKAHIIGTAIQNLNANANIAGGTINAISNGKKLDLNINKLDLSKLLIITGMPNYASGIINAKANFDSIDFKNLNGNLDLNAKGLLNASVLSKILEKKFPENTNYDLNAKINLKNNIAIFNSHLKSSLANLNNFEGKFDISKMKLNSNYILELNDFSKLGFLVDRKLKGKASFDGKFNFESNLIDASINSKNIFDGSLNANLQNNIFNASMKNTNLSTLAQSLDLPDYYLANSDLDVNYNIIKEQGKVVMNLKNGQLKRNLLTNALIILLQKDITKDVYRDGKAEININKNLIDLNLNLNADRSNINISKGKIDTKSTKLDIPFKIMIDRANFKGTIKGTTEDPKVNLDAGSVIKSITNTIGGNTSDATKSTGEKVDKAIDKIFNKIF